MTFFPMLLSGNENSEQKSNPMLQPLDLHLSRSPTLVTFNPIQDGLFQGCSQMGGGGWGKKASLP